MNRRLMTMVAATGAVLLAWAGMAPQASAAAPAHRSATSAAKAPCTTTYKVTGKSVAVRKPAWNDGPVAKPNSPVVRTLHRGDTVTSCAVAIARSDGGAAYHKCGKDGHIWQIVKDDKNGKGGQVPATCLKGPYQSD